MLKAFAGLASLPAVAGAALVTEPFVVGTGGYTANGNLSGQNPTVSGFASSAWAVTSSDTVAGTFRTVSGSLLSPVLVEETGGRVAYTRTTSSFSDPRVDIAERALSLGSSFNTGDVFVSALLTATP